MTPEQIMLFEMPVGLTPAQLHCFLTEGLRHRLKMVLTRNRVSMVSVQFLPNREIRLRLHEAFREAPSEVLHALRLYLQKRNAEAWRMIQGYAREIPVREEGVNRRQQVSKTKGAYYDLAEIRDAVNIRYFSGGIQCDIGWGRMLKKRRRRGSLTLCFGSCDQEARIIRINPRLDSPKVPQAFVEYIVFHEMLHLAVPSVTRNGRYVHHTEEFRAVERSYPRFGQMQRTAKRLAGELK